MKHNISLTIPALGFLIIVIFLLLSSCTATKYYNSKEAAQLVIKDSRDSILLTAPAQGKFGVNTKYLPAGTYKVSVGSQTDTIKVN